jgi:hypothetical protein
MRKRGLNNSGTLIYHLKRLRFFKMRLKWASQTRRLFNFKWKESIPSTTWRMSTRTPSSRLLLTYVVRREGYLIREPWSGCRCDDFDATFYVGSEIPNAIEEASVALLTSRIRPARRQTSHLLEQRKAPVLPEFPFATTRKQKTIAPKGSEGRTPRMEKWWEKGGDFKGKLGKFPPNRKPIDRTKAIASAVEKKVAERMKSMAQEKANEGETEAYIMSIFEKYNGGKGKKAQISDVEASTSVSAPSLKSILKRAQNGKS